MKKVENQSYIALKLAGFGFNITTLHGGKAYLYLVKSGQRVTRTMFKSNNQMSAILMEKLPYARNFTHLGNALATLAAENVKYSGSEIETMALEMAEKRGLNINYFGINDIVQECLYYQDEEGRDVESQLDYIFDQSIPDGLRENYFD